MEGERRKSAEGGDAKKAAAFIGRCAGARISFWGFRRSDRFPSSGRCGERRSIKRSRFSAGAARSARGSRAPTTVAPTDRALRRRGSQSVWAWTRDAGRENTSGRGRRWPNGGLELQVADGYWNAPSTGIPPAYCWKLRGFRAHGGHLG